MTAQRVGRGLGAGAGSDPGAAWAFVLGTGFIVFGLFGFVPNPIAGAPSVAWGTPLFLTGHARDTIDLILGAVVLYGALGLTVQRRGGLLIAVGSVALALFLLGLLSGTWVGVVGYPVNLLDQASLLFVGVTSVVVGWRSRGGSLPWSHPGRSGPRAEPSSSSATTRAPTRR